MKLGIILKKVLNMAKKFDIIIHDQDPQVKPVKESGVVAASVQDLISTYKMCGQNVEILREYEDEESKNYGRMDPAVEEQLKQAIESKGGKLSNHENMNTQVINTQVSKDGKIIPEQREYPSTTPKFFKVGNIECKIENGKVYQKQWMRLSDTEMNNYRIVSDKNNKISTLKDKHIEMLKWVISEDNTENV